MSNPYEHDDPDGTDPVEDDKFCRGCDGILPDPSQAKWFNGWTWCSDCYAGLEPVIQELARAHTTDERRDDFMDRVRR